jgi:diketogulonate reductase-like aldo/keto reductase
MSIDTVKLNDGHSIPWLGFGTGTALYGKDCEELVASAIESGFTHIDGAQAYGNEDSLGAGVIASNKPRSALFITTKLFQLRDGQTVRDTLIRSLRQLKTDYVDLFLIHTPTSFVGRLSETWADMERVQSEGLVKSIGVSNFRVKELDIILDGASIVPAVNQVRLLVALVQFNDTCETD